VFFAGYALPSFAEEQILKIGIVHSVTGGSAALYGIEQKNAIEMAIDEINESRMLGDIRVVGIHMDDGADKAQTVNIFQRLINQDKVQVILGASLATLSFAADPIAQAAGVPVIASSNTAAGITDIGNYIFRTSPPENILFPGVLAYAERKYNIKKAAQLYGIDDQLMKSAYLIHKEALAGAGIEVLLSETFNRGDVDFSAQLTKIKAAGPDVVVLGALAEESANILYQARQLGIGDNVVFLGANAAISTKLFELAGPAANGFLVGASWYAEYPSPKNQAFVAAYVKRYGHKPDVFGAQAYDAAYIVAEAVRRVGRTDDRKAIRDAIAATRDFTGVIGKLSFSATREPIVTPKVLEARGGSFVPAE
jgi:branched-chain amino acid transport system substrate-binding protein